MDEITLQINAGIETVTALIDSSQSRLRPVMMASLTTILGMIPIAIRRYVRFTGSSHYGRVAMQYTYHTAFYTHIICFILQDKKRLIKK